MRFGNDTIQKSSGYIQSCEKKGIKKIRIQQKKKEETKQLKRAAKWLFEKS